MSYRSLDAKKIIENAEQLSQRVEERFSGRGIYRIAGEVRQVAQEAQQRADWIARPHWGLRLGVFLLLGLFGGGMVLATISIIGWVEIGRLDIASLLEAINNGVNDILLLGAGLFFLVTFESRIKRGRALKALHELRSLAHVIDMHQLTKDPERLLSRGSPTANSPVELMNSFELSRYLDYCSEMLSLLGKVAALYVQNFDDSVALSAVNEIEVLTTGLSRKIWQKIMILYSMENHAPSALIPEIDLSQQTDKNYSLAHEMPKLETPDEH